MPTKPSLSKRKTDIIASRLEIDNMLKNGRRVLREATWRDLIALAAMLLAGLTWGLKLDNRQEEFSRRLSGVETQIAVGILPRADERLRLLERDMSYIQAEQSRLLETTRDTWEELHRALPPTVPQQPQQPQQQQQLRDTQR